MSYRYYRQCKCRCTLNCRSYLNLVASLLGHGCFRTNVRVCSINALSFNHSKPIIRLSIVEAGITPLLAGKERV